MEEKIQSLYKELRNITAAYLIYQERNNLEQIRKIIPQIEEFVLWFLKENKFGLEEELYQGLCSNLLYIMGDILEALEQGDRVLLHDAAAYGLMEYLEMFIETEQEETA